MVDFFSAAAGAAHNQPKSRRAFWIYIFLDMVHSDTMFFVCWKHVFFAPGNPVWRRCRGQKNNVKRVIIAAGRQFLAWKILRIYIHHVDLEDLLILDGNGDIMQSVNPGVRYWKQGKRKDWLAIMLRMKVRSGKVKTSWNVVRARTIKSCVSLWKFNCEEV